MSNTCYCPCCLRNARDEPCHPHPLDVSPIFKISSSQMNTICDDLICPVCRHIPSTPLFFDCGHAICHQCEEKLNSQTCPICRSNITNTTTCGPIAFRTFLNHIQSTCSCGMQFYPGYFDDHLEGFCQDEPEQCSGCNLQCRRRNISSHKRKCPAYMNDEITLLKRKCRRLEMDLEERTEELDIARETLDARRTPSQSRSRSRSPSPSPFVVDVD